MRSDVESQALAKLGPTYLATIVDRRFELADHLELIDQTIVEAVWRATEHRRDRPEIILVTAPPRHGKSTVTSLWTPALVPRHLPRAPRDPRLL